MSKLKVKGVDWVKVTSRCVCGACNHHITRVDFDNGDYWIPTNSEFVAIQEMLEICLLHNLATDKHCFKAKQKVDHNKIFGKLEEEKKVFSTSGDCESSNGDAIVDFNLLNDTSFTSASSNPKKLLGEDK